MVALTIAVEGSDGTIASSSEDCGFLRDMVAIVVW